MEQGLPCPYTVRVLPYLREKKGNLFLSEPVIIAVLRDKKKEGRRKPGVPVGSYGPHIHTPNRSMEACGKSLPGVVFNTRYFVNSHRMLKTPDNTNQASFKRTISEFVASVGRPYFPSRMFSTSGNNLRLEAGDFQSPAARRVFSRERDACATLRTRAGLILCASLYCTDSGSSFGTFQ
jgi:hypothetical protein